MSFILKAASQCQHLPETVKAFRSGLKALGTEVAQCVLDFLSHTGHTNADVAEAILSSIDSYHELDSDCTITCGTYSFWEYGNSLNGLLVGNDHVDGCHHHTNGYILVEMLSVPGLFVEVSQVFERALIRECIGLRAVALVLER